MKQAMFESSYLSEFYMELYLITRAGISYQEGIALLLEEEHDQVKKKSLQQLKQHLELGESLSEAFRLTGTFPSYAVEMIAIGQSAGRLEQVFFALSGYYERMMQIKQSVQNMVWYPMILICMMLFVVLVLLIEVMPIFADVFAQLGAEFSPVAQLMLQIGMGLRQYGLVILAVLAAAVIVLTVLYKKTSFSDKLQQVGTGIVSNWNVNRVLTQSKLADALTLTLSSGMDIDDALTKAGTLVQNKTVQDQIVACRKSMLLEGKAFADACMEQGLFAPMYCRMIAVGFRTGDIDTVMAEVARRVAGAADDAMDELLNRIEPVLVIVMSLMVGIILLSVMLPLMGIMTAIG